MNNWSIDEEKLKNNPRAHTIWKLSQMANFGLGNEKLPIRDIKKNINKLSIDPLKKRYLKFLIK